MKKPIAPCVDCQDRTPGCHGSCERYKSWLGPIVEARENRKSIMAKNKLTADFLKRSRDKRARDYAPSNRR